MERSDNLMKYPTLGRSGLKVSHLSIGSALAWGKDDQEACNEVIKFAWDNGINFFDTAEAYFSGVAEALLGNALKNLNVPRSDYVVSTKIFWGKYAENTNSWNNTGTSKKRLIEGVNRSLSNLKTDYIDVVFCHRYDFHTPTIEVVHAMKTLFEQGKILYWGTSSWPVERVMEAILLADSIGCPRPIAEQCSYSMLDRNAVDKDYIALFDDYGYGTTTYSPLFSGLLTGKYNKGIPEDSRVSKHRALIGYGYDQYFGTDEKKKATIGKFNKLAEVAKKLDTTMAVLAIAWASLSKDATTVLLGARNTKQLSENLKALEIAPKITPKIAAEIEEILDNKPKQETDYTTFQPLPDRR